MPTSYITELPAAGFVLVHGSAPPALQASKCSVVSSEDSQACEEGRLQQARLAMHLQAAERTVLLPRGENEEVMKAERQLNT